MSSTVVALHVRVVLCVFARTVLGELLNVSQGYDPQGAQGKLQLIKGDVITLLRHGEEYNGWAEVPTNKLVFFFCRND